jgi:hypothetical protein
MKIMAVAPSGTINFEVGQPGAHRQEKLDFGFCAIKSIVFAMLAVEVILVFLIRHRLRVAWAVMLNRFGRKFHG